MSIQNALASVAVADLEAVVDWYATLLGREPDSRPMPEVAEWRFPRGGWLQVYELAERAGHGSVTLSIDDLDGAVARLGELGIDTSRRTSSAQAKTLAIRDPAGNHIVFAQALDRSMAR